MTEKMTVITNNQPRLLLSWEELTEKERKENDYLAVGLSIPEGTEFVRYKGQAYELGEFSSTVNVGPLAGWDGYTNDTFYSGLCLKWLRDENGNYDFDRVVMGRWFV